MLGVTGFISFLLLGNGGSGQEIRPSEEKI
jgi:hypothetical protein